MTGNISTANLLCIQLIDAKHLSKTMMVTTGTRTALEKQDPAFNLEWSQLPAKARLAHVGSFCTPEGTNIYHQKEQGLRSDRPGF